MDIVKCILEHPRINFAMVNDEGSTADEVARTQEIADTIKCNVAKQEVIRGRL